MAAEGGFLDAQVSKAFVERYYRVVGTMAHEAHKFYADGSLVTRPGPDGTVMSFSSLEGIKKHYLSSYYDGATFEVLSIDTQSSLGYGLFIMVVGFLTGKDNLKRKFSQAFYLARQEGGYVVVNDIHRFVHEESSTTGSLPADVFEVAKPVEEVKKTKQVHKATKKKSPSVAEVKKVAAASETSVTAQKPKEPVAETAALPPPLDGGNKSFASMVRSMPTNTAPLQVKAAPVQKPSPVAVVAEPKPHAAPATEKKREKMVDEPGTSIFVSNLPMDARWPDVFELFKDFGAIKQYGVQIRSSRASERCFAFVAFESVASVQSVLKAAKSNQFWLGDYKLRVREKEVGYDGSKSQNGSVDGRKSQSGSVDGRKSQSGSVDGRKSQSGSVDGRKSQSGSVDGRKSQSGSVDGRKPSGGRKSQSGSADGSKSQSESVDGSKTENGTVASQEDEGYTLVISRRERKEKRRQ